MRKKLVYIKIFWKGLTEAYLLFNFYWQLYNLNFESRFSWNYRVKWLWIIVLIFIFFLAIYVFEHLSLCLPLFFIFLFAIRCIIHFRHLLPAFSSSLPFAFLLSLFFLLLLSLFYSFIFCFLVFRLVSYFRTSFVILFNFLLIIPVRHFPYPAPSCILTSICSSVFRSAAFLPSSSFSMKSSFLFFSSLSSPLSASNRSSFNFLSFKVYFCVHMLPLIRRLTRISSKAQELF